MPGHEQSKLRLVALVKKTDIHPSSRQVIGFPEFLESSATTLDRLPWPRVLLVETKEDGIFLFRLDENGAFCGDTWHASIEDAKGQASAEYEGLISEWWAVPEVVPNNDSAVVKFALG